MVEFKLYQLFRVSVERRTFVDYSVFSRFLSGVPALCLLAGCGAVDPAELLSATVRGERPHASSARVPTSVPPVAWGASDEEPPTPVQSPPLVDGPPVPGAAEPEPEPPPPPANTGQSGNTAELPVNTAELPANTAELPVNTAEPSANTAGGSTAENNTAAGNTAEPPPSPGSETLPTPAPAHPTPPPVTCGVSAPATPTDEGPPVVVPPPPSGSAAPPEDLPPADATGEPASTESSGSADPADETLADETPADETPANPEPAEDGGAACAVAPLPTFAELPEVESLPDPFLSLSGERVTDPSQWQCRRAEIKALVEEFELGPKPSRPSIVSGEFSGNVLTVTAGEPERTITFSVTINRPAGASEGPIPALIAIGGSSLDASVFRERGIATITFGNNAMGAQSGASSRGRGLFYSVYGEDHPASSMIAWAWGVSRLIDALELTGAAAIDTRHLGVTGCSRNGKGALVVGAFDERIALTIPQESGAGGSASWRVSQVQHDLMPVETRDDPNFTTQTVLTAQGEQPWFRENFGQFATTNVTRLPFDHHMVMGLVAPRGLFVVDNTSMNWLGNESSFTDSVAAREIWSVLGVPANMGASQIGDHNHCAFPASQRGELVAFVDRFLLGDETADTNVLRSDRIVPNRARWMPWAAPTE